MSRFFAFWALALAPACAPGPALPPAFELADPSELDPAVVQLLQERLEAVRARPEDGALHGQLGLALEANGFWREAARSFVSAAHFEPAEPHWDYHRAIVLDAAGEHEGALELLRQLVTRLPEAPYVAQRLGEIALACGNLEEARRAFERTRKLGPESAEGHAGFGACELLLARTKPAALALERALALDASYKRAHYQLGLAYRELGRTEEAGRELALGLHGDVRFLPDPFANEVRRAAVAGPARLQYALELLASGRPERAVRVLEKLNEKQPGDVTVLNDLAIALQRSGELERAQALLEQAAALAPEVVSTWINLSALALEQHTSARALECAERALALAPQSAKAHLARARVLLLQGKTTEALAALASARRFDPRELDALLLAGQAQLAAGAFAEAQVCFAELAAQRPQDPGPHLGLAEVFLAQGQRAAARQELAAARARGPDHPEVVALAARLAGE